MAIELTNTIAAGIFSTLASTDGPVVPTKNNAPPANMTSKQQNVVHVGRRPFKKRNSSANVSVGTCHAILKFSFAAWNRCMKAQCKPLRTAVSNATNVCTPAFAMTSFPAICAISTHLYQQTLAAAMCTQGIEQWNCGYHYDHEHRCCWEEMVAILFWKKQQQLRMSKTDT